MKRSDLKHWNNKKYWVEYDTTIQTILNRMFSKEQSKELVIPEYQRDYVWKESKAPELLLSLYKGFPIGNIVLWDSKNDDGKGENLYLIDGLQRHLTILKLYEKEFNYVSFNLYKYWLKQNNFDLFKEKEKIIKKKNGDIKKINLNEKEAFRHFKSSMHHKSKGYKSSNFNDAIFFLNKTNAHTFTEEIRERFINFVTFFHQWHKNEFKEINVPHYILDKMNINEVAKVFELINITGEKLTTFEIASANWSRFLIKLNEEIDFIKEFNESRKNKYKNSFENKEKIGEQLISFDNFQVIPSNFLYALLYEVLKNDKELKATFLDHKNKYTLVTKSIEPLCEVVMHILKKEFNVGDFEFNDLGKVLSENIKSIDDVEKIRKRLSGLFTKLKNNVPLIKMARLNGDTKYPKYPTWLIAILLIHILYGKGLDKLEDWFIKELIFDNRLNSATGTKARQVINKFEFENDLNIDIINECKSLFDNHEFIDKSYDDRDKAILLAMIQKENRSASSIEHIDHFLPQSKLSEYVEGIDTIWNLQYMEKGENESKNDKLIIEQWTLDVFKNSYNKTQKENIQKLCKQLIKELEKDNNEEINLLYQKIINIRKKVMTSILNN